MLFKCEIQASDFKQHTYNLQLTPYDLGIITYDLPATNTTYDLRFIAYKFQLIPCNTQPTKCNFQLSPIYLYTTTNSLQLKLQLMNYNL